MAIKLKIELPNLREESIENLIKRLKLLNPDQAVRVFCSDRKFIRSRNQNAYYWGVVIRAFSEHSGIDPTSCHCVLKEKFLKGTIEVNDSIFEITRDSKSLNTKEFTEYLDHCRIFLANDLDIPTPDPNYLTDEQYIEYMTLSGK